MDFDTSLDTAMLAFGKLTDQQSGFNYSWLSTRDPHSGEVTLEMTVSDTRNVATYTYYIAHEPLDTRTQREIIRNLIDKASREFKCPKPRRENTRGVLQHLARMCQEALA